jgi:DNA-binding response OmpR family regulator
MTDYLTKPIDPRALMAALSKAASMGSPVTGGVNDADAKVAKSA